ncbi:ABC transporter substrate-binding protein [Castellaniella sp. GW247-6E4]|uniref:ABC transporter substrate-binding protein n=1 Tax=Castellaniella sp. GW247-6E4 TaxID=3140380 RepID=UPI003315140D
MKHGKQNTGASISRRAMLKSGTALIGSVTIGFPLLGKAQSDAIKIGHLTPMTGFLGALGNYAVMGIQLATEQINAGGGLLGRKLDVLSEDSVNPQVASSKAQRMIERDHVMALMGEISSASALAISQVANRNKILFLNTGARSDTLRGKDCNRYTFHIDIPVTVMVNAAGEALARDGLIKGKKIYALTADYLFGHDLSTAVRKFVKAHDGTIIGDELVATDVTDFSPYLLKIRQARPDVVACNLAGNQVTNFVKQYAEFGLQYPIAGFNLNTADAWAAGPGNLSGIWPTVWHHKLQTPGTRAFVAEFTKKYNKIPENHAWIEYISLKILAQAISETKSTDTDKLIAYLESGAQFDILKARKAYFRPWDHQLMQEAYPFTVMPPDQVKGPQDFLVFGDPVPAPDQSLEVLAPSKAENTCVM